jgi:hypothetical protein
MSKSAIAIVLCALGCATTPRDATVETRGDKPQPSDLEIPIEQSLVVRGEWNTADSHVARVRRGTYVRPPAGENGERGVIVLEGARNMTLDLEGVALRGTQAGTDLDRNTGIGIVLRNCESVTIRGGSIGGYRCASPRSIPRPRDRRRHSEGWFGRVALDARGRVETDWLYPHHNDDGEWMKNYGAAIAPTIAGARPCAIVAVATDRDGILLTRANECTSRRRLLVPCRAGVSRCTARRAIACRTASSITACAATATTCTGAARIRRDPDVRALLGQRVRAQQRRTAATASSCLLATMP